MAQLLLELIIGFQCFSGTVENVSIAQSIKTCFVLKAVILITH